MISSPAPGSAGVPVSEIAWVSCVVTGSSSNLVASLSALKRPDECWESTIFELALLAPLDLGGGGGGTTPPSFSLLTFRSGLASVLCALDGLLKLAWRAGGGGGGDSLGSPSLLCVTVGIEPAPA